MINAEEFSNFSEYEDYINKVSLFWTLFNYWDSRFNKDVMKRITISNKVSVIGKINRSEITYWAIEVVNDLEYLNEQIKMLEKIRNTNDENLAEKYSQALRKSLDIIRDFQVTEKQ